MSSPTVAKPFDPDKPESWPDPTAPARRCALGILVISTLQLVITLAAWWK